MTAWAGVPRREPLASRRTAGGDRRMGAPTWAPLQRHRLLRYETGGAEAVKACKSPSGPVHSGHRLALRRPSRGAMTATVGWQIAPLVAWWRNWQLGAERGGVNKAIDVRSSSELVVEKQRDRCNQGLLGEGRGPRRGVGVGGGKKGASKRTTWRRARSNRWRRQPGHRPAKGQDAKNAAWPPGMSPLTWLTAPRDAGGGSKPPRVPQRQDRSRLSSSPSQPSHPDMGVPLILMPPGSRGGYFRVLLPPPSLPRRRRESGARLARSD